ncbi:acylphosphatase [Arthrobacter mobilis]|uniref:acylphosphatase n=1 Tax=Arthrobacter mobilis TaxID=2724944 RepID=A0A7X6K606_9MICC|nr:acylphosphatase [Arthrobacter mobilis]NKX54158.1 acylphosphatase [Arthrobacter mobilis]
MDGKLERLSATVAGHVQGVGFRYWTRSQAERLGLDGQAVNSPDGTVRITAEGPRPALERLVALLRSEAPGRVDRVDTGFAEATGGFRGFDVG